MTFEEMHQIIQEMVSVQRDLQETQIKQQATVGDLAQRQEQFAQRQEQLARSQEQFAQSQEQLAQTQEQFAQNIEQFARNQEQFAQNIENQKDILQELIERYGDLAQNSQRQQTILDQLIGYSINAESDRLDLQEQLNLLKQKVEKIERQKS